MIWTKWMFVVHRRKILDNKHLCPGVRGHRGRYDSFFYNSALGRQFYDKSYCAKHCIAEVVEECGGDDGV